VRVTLDQTSCDDPKFDVHFTVTAGDDDKIRLSQGMTVPDIPSEQTTNGIVTMTENQAETVRTMLKWAIIIVREDG